MLKIKIIAMGKLTEKAYREACGEFIKRLSRTYPVTVVEPKVELLPSDPSAGEIKRALEKESERILSEVSPRSTLVALCVEGKSLSSEAFSAFIEKQATGGVSEICFVIGSSFGLSDEVKKKAALRLSLSEMTFPHELFRVMLLEQIYRAGEIAAGSRYHK